MFLHIRVIPNSKRTEVTKLDDENYKIKLNAPAIEGRANARLIEVLSEYFKTSKHSVRISKGQKTRDKIVEIC